MKRINHLTLFLILVIVFSILLVLFPWSILDGIEIGRFKFNINSYNEFGSFVGGITSPIFSLAAFILLFLTFKNQKNENVKARVDLNNQIRLATNQNQESTFFNLLNNHILTVNAMSVTHRIIRTVGNKKETEHKLSQGKNAISYMVQIIERKYEKGVKNIKGFSKYDPIEEQGIGFDKIDKIDKAFVELFHELNSNLNSYTQSLSIVLNYIEIVENPNKIIWLNTIKSHLSKWEQLVLIYYCNTSIVSNSEILLIKKLKLIDIKLVEKDILDKCFLEIIK